MIEKVAIRNYRSLRELDIELLPGLNLIVGHNDTGKSTLLEAVNLALTGRLHGRPLPMELSPYLVNLEATTEYIEQLRAGSPIPAPSIVIEVYLEDMKDSDILRGTNNLYSEDACGVRIQASLSEEFAEEYEGFISNPGDVRLAPTEYYRVEWVGFSGNAVTARSVPAAVSVIDPATIRSQTGVDHHLQYIIRTHLDPKERVELSRQYRNLREDFADKDAVKTVNTKLGEESGSLTDRDLTLGIDISQRYTWEGSVIAHLDEIPFPYAGKGEQSALKTLLAITQKAETAHIVLIEEPENHLSFTSLRRLIGRIADHCEGKQVVIATHSTYVLNKLGLDQLLLLAREGHMRLTDVPVETVEYFKKLAGHDTLRLVLADSVILVEGPSDELVVQRAYFDEHGKLPIDDGIDVISVGLAHRRFLDIAVGLNRRARVLTDNDGKTEAEILQRFADYASNENISIHTGDDPALPTLEPQLVDVNDLAKLNEVLGKAFASKEDVTKWMSAEKTSAALAIFESEKKLVMPKYIRDAVG